MANTFHAQDAEEEPCIMEGAFHMLSRWLWNAGGWTLHLYLSHWYPT